VTKLISIARCLPRGIRVSDPGPGLRHQSYIVFEQRVRTRLGRRWRMTGEPVSWRPERPIARKGQGSGFFIALGSGRTPFFGATRELASHFIGHTSFQGFLEGCCAGDISIGLAGPCRSQSWMICAVGLSAQAPVRWRCRPAWQITYRYPPGREVVN